MTGKTGQQVIPLLACTCCDISFEYTASDGARGAANNKLRGCDNGESFFVVPEYIEALRPSRTGHSLSWIYSRKCLRRCVGGLLRPARNLCLCHLYLDSLALPSSRSAEAELAQPATASMRRNAGR